MGAIRIKVQTADNSITSNPSINIQWSEKLHVYKKQIHN